VEIGIRLFNFSRVLLQKLLKARTKSSRGHFYSLMLLHSDSVNNITCFFKIAIEDHVIEKMFNKWERKDFRSAGKKAMVV
jgi:hypothetical protein